MAVLYPPAQPSLSGDVLTISRFLNSPTLVARRLRTLAEQRFISDVLLSGRIATTSGSVLYETGESIYSDRAPKSVAPGAEYPLTPISTGDASLAKTVKWGNDAEVTDESIARQMFSPVDKAMTKLVNQTVKTVDGVAMSAIHSAVSQNTACIATWTGGGSTPQILRDIARARGKIDALNQGYDPDYLVVDDATYANLVSDASVAALLRRENGANPVYTGTFPVIDGLTVPALPEPDQCRNHQRLRADRGQQGAGLDGRREPRRPGLRLHRRCRHPGEVDPRGQERQVALALPSCHRADCAGAGRRVEDHRGGGSVMSYKVAAPCVLAVDADGHTTTPMPTRSSNGSPRLRPSTSWPRAWWRSLTPAWWPTMAGRRWRQAAEQRQEGRPGGLAGRQRLKEDGSDYTADDLEPLKVAELRDLVDSVE